MDYRVELPAFSGPLDLLLHLVKRQEVSIHEVQISRILGDYLVYVRALETLDLDNIGEFLVMASTLMEIKSREILPRETVDLREELDPRDELIRQLIEYNRYREITRRLEGRGKDRERRFSRGAFGADPRQLSDMARERFEQDVEESLDLEDLDVWFLLKAYAELLQETDFGKVYEVEHDDRTLAWHIGDLRRRLEAARELRFREAFDPAEGKIGLIGAFMALLELMKQGEVRAQQDGAFGEIVLRWIAPAEDAELAAGP
ncbi:MAG: segregation/condensation protein A [Planctomycetota bacterium]